MLCEKCGKKSATTHIRSVINGEVFEKHLCDICAASEGYGDKKGNNLSQMLSSMFDNSIKNSTNSQYTRCNCCGSNFDDIAKSGKCGCPECYTTFYQQLLPYLKRVHGSTKHIGKIPTNIAPSETKADKVSELRKLLNQLVKDENYEQAAVVRDQIKQLEGETL